MIENDPNKDFADRRSDERKPPEKYYSVQFSIKDIGYFYQFKIWDISSQGMCILVGEDSSVVGHLNVGDVIKMQYYLSDSIGSTEDFETEISHITKKNQGRFKGHYLVGLAILDPETESQ
ncbi:MAG: PilZ domain-containing protein [Deltaproteobacteria bacterium]|nr:PilZ domain-containing protein [Deltaproteobacteria bacterium]MBW2635195.1 PilZ domain-containing protein [Deltaproteobacteria bacterium]MBW2678880.1 PilZ domain-containing protein [Deltaproteobacteria bacterium]